MIPPKLDAYLTKAGWPSFWDWWILYPGRDKVYSRFIYGKILN